MEYLHCTCRHFGEQEGLVHCLDDNYLGPSEEFKKVFYKLPEEMRAKLFGFTGFETKVNQFTGEEEIVHTGRCSGNFLFEHSGLGDMSVIEDRELESLFDDGNTIQLYSAHLNGLEDLRALIDFLNELEEIVHLAQMETGAPIPEEDVEWGIYSIFGILDIFWSFQDIDPSVMQDDPYGMMDILRRYSRREYHQKLMENDFAGMNALYVNEDIRGEDQYLFLEADNIDNWARLRIRRQNGKFVYEIADAEQ